MTPVLLAVLVAVLSCAVLLAPLFAAAAGVVIGPPTAAAGLALVSAVFALALGWPGVFVVGPLVPVPPLALPVLAVVLPGGVVVLALVLEPALSDLPLHAASAAAITTTLHAIL